MDNALADNSLDKQCLSHSAMHNLYVHTRKPFLANLERKIRSGKESVRLDAQIPTQSGELRKSEHFPKTNGCNFNFILQKETYAELQFNLLQEEQQKKKEENANSNNKGIKAVILEFLKPTGYKPIIILNGLFFFQHFSGIYITMFYSISFIEVKARNVYCFFSILCDTKISVKYFFL